MKPGGGVCGGGGSGGGGCVYVCVCLFPFTIKASRDWAKQ